jgi:NAD(P)-dependent dehydrogenase (short-subunit alcohol dehydrogenase family)
MMAELSRRLEGRGVSCNAAHPGMVDTDIARYFLENAPAMPFGDTLLYAPFAFPLQLFFTIVFFFVL